MRAPRQTNVSIFSLFVLGLPDVHSISHISPLSTMSTTRTGLIGSQPEAPQATVVIRTALYSSIHYLLTAKNISGSYAATLPKHNQSASAS